jgi:Mn-dependent DtxR family transcriptional regulator
MTTLNDKQVNILAQVATGVNTLGAVAENLGVSVQSITGNLAGLKKLNLVEYHDGHLELTEEGKKMTHKETIDGKEEVIDAAKIDAAVETEVKKIKEKAEKPAKVKVEKEPRVTKKDQAWAIIEAMAGARRKDVTAEIMAKLNVTENNAGAYIQNYRKAHDLVVPREKEVEKAAAAA